MSVIYTFKHSSVPELRLYGLEADAKPIIDEDGRAMPAGSDFLELDTGKTYVFDGTNWIFKERIGIDESTYAKNVITYPHHELHSGSAYAAHVIDSDMDKSNEINICFTTPNTKKYLHVMAFPVSSVFAEFKICKGATVTATTGTDLSAYNRNHNKPDASGILSTKDGTTTKFTYNATVAADGTIRHTEMLGSSKQGAGSGSSRGCGEYVLAPNIKYAFRIVGNGVSNDNGVASLELSWYEHTDKTFA